MNPEPPPASMPVSERAESVSKVGLPAPYYADELVTLYNADCLDVLPLLPRADLIFTSPPYNLGVTTGGGFGHGTNWRGKWAAAATPDGIGGGYADHDDAMVPAVYEEWQRAVLLACWAQLADTGAIFYNHKPRVQAGTLWTPLAVNPGLPVRQIIVWARAGGMNFAPTHYVPTHEWIVVLAKPDWRLKSKGASGAGDVWRVPQESRNPHPAPFPVSLPACAIETAGPRLVIDPFAGSGSTLVAAKAAGVPAIGIEISKRYCDMAVARLAQGALDFGGAA